MLKKHRQKVTFRVTAHFQVKSVSADYEIPVRTPNAVRQFLELFLLPVNGEIEKLLSEKLTNELLFLVV
jgi:hypothetical protein